MLLIDRYNKYGRSNKTGIFLVTNDNRSKWTGLPASMPTTGTVIGLREVFANKVGLNEEHIFVRVTEFFPVAGRQYCTFLNYGNWSGWKTLPPQ